MQCMTTTNEFVNRKTNFIGSEDKLREFFTASFELPPLVSVENESHRTNDGRMADMRAEDSNNNPFERPNECAERPNQSAERPNP
jgi:hypothetical protein